MGVVAAAPRAHRTPHDLSSWLHKIRGLRPCDPRIYRFGADWLRCWAVITHPALVRTRVSARVPSLDCPILCTSAESITDRRLPIVTLTWYPRRSNVVKGRKCVLI